MNNAIRSILRRAIVYNEAINLRASSYDFLRATMRQFVSSRRLLARVGGAPSITRRDSFNLQGYYRHKL